MLDKFEVLMSWKLTWGLSLLFFGVSDGHIFFDFSKYWIITLINEFSSRSLDPVVTAPLFAGHEDCVDQVMDYVEDHE